MRASKAAKAPRPARRGAGKEHERNEAGASSEDYVIGQVVNSLFQNKSTTCREQPLAHLFNTSQSETQPVFVAVPREKKKRKHTDVETTAEDQSSSAKREAPIKIKKLKKMRQSVAEKKLANRESTLEQADEEEEKKEIKVKQKLKNRTSQAEAKRLASSANEIDVKQCKKKSQISDAEEMLKNQRTVFVGNLPVSCTVQVPAEDTLSKKLAAIRRKIHPNVKYINAYVVFKDKGAATRALKRNGTQIASGFHIRVDLASKATSHDNKRSIFVGNLSYDIEDDTVREHFSECGNVVAVRIVRDKNTGIGKGFGYVLFENTDAVHLALKLNNSELKGRTLRVKRCVEQEKKQKSADNMKDSAPKHRFGSSLKNAPRYTKNSFAGEKASPSKKKTKRPKSVTKKKGGKHK
ncbi:RNA-binding protein 34 isoform X2 [Carettochelys insculpta]|uniref:RNA-binding protein 34 isoform X2 n=1 Tax=Carettochelys insculpta TaxID=44489 RepID=UPI003EB7B96F